MERPTLSTGPVARYYAFEVTQAVALTLPIFVVFFQSRGLSLAEVGLIEATYTVVALFAETPTGYVGDRLGRRRTLVASAVLAGAGAAAFALARSLPAFLAVIALRAIAGALRSGTGDAWLYELLSARPEYDPGSFARYRGRAGALGRVTAGVSVLVGGLLDAVDPTAPWILEGTVVALGGSLALTMPEPPRTGDGENHPGGDPSPFEAMRSAGGTLWRPDCRRLVAFTAVLFSVAAGAHVLVQPASVELAGLNPAHLGVLYATMVTTSALAVDRVEWVRDVIGIDGWFAMAPAGAGVLALSVLVFPPVVLLAFVCLRTVSAVSGPLLNQYLNDRAGDASRATTLSAAAMSRQLVIAPTKLAVGILAGATLSYAVAGLGVALLAGTAVAAVLGGPVQRGGSTPEGATAGP
jgi:MFS family permease